MVWNARSLDRWLTNPEGFIPGQKMGYTVPDAQDRADIIAFLASITVLPALSLALAQAGIGILALTPELATLEDLFFRLTET